MFLAAFGWGSFGSIQTLKRLNLITRLLKIKNIPK
jgi:hypothetical protein